MNQDPPDSDRRPACVDNGNRGAADVSFKILHDSCGAGELLAASRQAMHPTGGAGLPDQLSAHAQDRALRITWFEPPRQKPLRGAWPFPVHVEDLAAYAISLAFLVAGQVERIGRGVAAAARRVKALERL